MQIDLPKCCSYAPDGEKGPYIYFGAKTQNKETVEKAEKQIKGLSQFIFNYGQFVV